jgi:N-acetylated-alpha-linked acidic dipeptidase
MRTALLVVVAAMVSIIVATTAWERRPPVPFGFADASASGEFALERGFLRLPSAGRIRDSHHFFSSVPHLAGSPRDRELADYIRDQFSAFGFEMVTASTHEVLLPWPEETTVEMVAPRSWRASMLEEPVPGDTYTYAAPEQLGIPYHAYSASGEVTAPVVYAGSGNPEDYDHLEAMGIPVKGMIALVRYSVPYSYRGFKALTAQQRGAAGILIYSDPADDGFGKGRVYPDGPWGPPSHIQRGGIVYDFLIPGDPLTPGWASLPGARRIDRSEATSLPAIVSAPLSWKDARVLLESIGGPEAPAEWRGALPLTYRVGGGPLVVRMRVRADDRVRPIWTVTGMIRGSERPDQLVIVGNHRDAWIYGGVDPSSGTAAMMELARTMSELSRNGWRPKRTILFASWDAEEFTLTSSTEWGEEHAGLLQQNAVAYINVDSAASGRRFTASAVPSLNRLIGEVAQAVRDPAVRVPVSVTFRDAPAADALPGSSSHDLVNNRLGSGSDYTVFLNFLGVPVADLSFRGPYGVYHSAYDNHNWVARIGDPEFRYHSALVQIWGLMVLRLANADVLPFDHEDYGRRLAEFADEVGRAWAVPSDLDDPRNAVREFRAAAVAFERARQLALATENKTTLAELDRRLMRVERALIDPVGLPGRPWYRHVVFAPKFTYAAEVLPGVAEAVRSGDRARVRAASARLAAAVRRAAEALEKGVGAPHAGVPAARSVRDGVEARPAGAERGKGIPASDGDGGSGRAKPPGI